MTEDQPERLVVAHATDAGSKKTLRQLPCQCQLVSSLKKLTASDYRQHPNLFVVHSAGHEPEKIIDIISTLRHQHPLADIVIWAPRAAGPTVRAYFVAGAKDVVASQSGTSLTDVVQQTLDAQQLLPRVNDLSRLRQKSARFESMLSRSQVMWDQFELCDRIASSDATVLIIGETGTGKELLARAVHRRSGREGRFVAANCAGIAPELINSELFGHEKGAFTGADRAKQGLVTRANQGTLFLDEIGDMPREGQQSLLRMLQEMRIRPVGSLVETKVDVRVVAATNVPLDQAIDAGDFREDLFYRLDVIRMNIPPLRERPEDILFLFGHFIKRLSKDYGVKVPNYTDGFLDALADYDWPGNVRQLENFSERLLLSQPTHALTARDFAKLRSTSLAQHGKQPSKASAQSKQLPVDLSKTLAEHLEPAMLGLERDYLHAVLTHNNGRIGDSAKQAGISRRTLLRKMKAIGLEKESYKD